MVLVWNGNGASDASGCQLSQNSQAISKFCIYLTYCLDWFNFNFHQYYGFKFKSLKQILWSRCRLNGCMKRLKILYEQPDLILALISFWQKSGQNWLNGDHFKKKSILKFKFRIFGFDLDFFLKINIVPVTCDNFHLQY